MVVVVLIVGAVTFEAVVAVSRTPARAAAPGTMSLMQVLSEWKYPDAAMPSGASMSDAGAPGIPAARCQAVLTTPDSLDKVIAFYEEKMKAGGNTAADVAEERKGPRDQSVTVLDDSRGRPVAVRVIAINRRDSSTTLVISRGNGERETHIAWVHHVRLNTR
jgi:hypothetical protein